MTHTPLRGGSKWRWDFWEDGTIVRGGGQNDVVAPGGEPERTTRAAEKIAPTKRTKSQHDHSCSCLLHCVGTRRSACIMALLCRQSAAAPARVVRRRPRPQTLITTAKSATQRLTHECHTFIKARNVCALKARRQKHIVDVRGRKNSHPASA